MRQTNANAQTNTQWSDFSIFLTITLVLSLSCLPTTWALSDKRLCADEKCEQIISTGSAKINYASGEEGMISFKIRSPVRIMSKSAGSNMKLWGVDINGRRGYANKDFIMEKKIYVTEKDLKYEMPVQPLKPTAKAPAPIPIVNNPTENAHVPQEQQQPVLNASETAEDVATTTTSPLDTLKLSIVTEQDQSGSSEASTPITPVQANLQVVDGTELPLEALSATTERIENLTKAETLKEPRQPVEIDDIPTTTTSDDEFIDYEEDDDEFYNEDATLDSKDNEIPNDKKTANVDDIKVNVASKTEAEQVAKVEEKIPEVVVNPEPATTTTSQATPVVVQPEQQLNSSHEAETKHAASASPPAISPEAVPESVLNTIPSINEANVAKEPEPVPAAEVKLDTKVNEPIKPIATELKIEEQPIQKPLEVKEIEAEAVKEEATVQPIVKELADQPIKEEAKAESVEAQQLTNETAAQTAKAEIDSPQGFKPIETVSVPEVLLDNKTQADPAKEEHVHVEPIPITIETLKTERETNVSDPVKIEVQQAAEVLKATTEAQQNETSSIIVEEASIAAEVEVQQVKPEIQVPEVQQTEAQPTEAQQTKAEQTQPQPIEQSEAASIPADVQDSSTAAPTFETVTPLFEKQNFQNPNEYYKQLQEQEQHLAKAAAQQQQQQQREDAQRQEQQRQEQQREEQQKQEQQREEQQKQEQQREEQQKQEQQREEQQKQEQQRQKQQREEQQKQEQQREEQQRQEQQWQEQQRQEQQRQEQQREDQQRQEQTTPTPSTNDAYEAVYQAEPTPAPIKTEERLATGSVEPIGLPTLPTDSVKEDAGPGLFTTIMDTVNSFISNQGQKEPETAPLKGHDQLHRLLYPDRAVPEVDVQPEGYCTRPMDGDCHATITLDNFVEVLAAKVLEHSLSLLCVVIAAASSLFFMFVYYCFCNSSQEGALLSKLNHLERSLLAAHKENLILKHELMTTRTKLSSIEDNSFGSNDMVAALKKQLETELYEKAKLQEQVTSLEKDLDNAAEAGLELNKMLSEVLNGQNGDEAFMSTVEELQRQLNDQEKIIIEINGSLAEKSRENSELQYSYTESTTRLTGEMKSLQQDNYELEMEKAKLQTRIEEIQAETEQELAKALEARNYEMQRLQHQIMESTAKLDKAQSELHTSLAKIDALEECLKLVKKDGNINMQELIKSAKTRGELNAAQQKFLALQTKLEQELAAKTRLESQLKTSSADVEQLKQDFNQSERDKLEAQTRLEVLSGYFREKETELQKELSLQEAKWLQHQGENASTVETQTLMKNEIQTLKSQNDELRAEIEAQIASHKAQMGTLENRAHESWLAARQSERRCEEAQAEAAGLRRKLTTMASGAVGAAGDMTLDALPANGSMLAPELNSNPSPLPLPGSPGLLNMPNPLPFLPAPFSPFMGLPPPFLPPVAAAGGARLPPLGRMRSPPPASSSRGDRYDDRDDYSDYDDYDDEDDDERLMDRRRRHSGSWGRGHRDDYMHSPRTYRSLSPSDSRYNYNDTETDFSPPPSPPPPRKSSRPLNEV